MDNIHDSLVWWTGFTSIHGLSHLNSSSNWLIKFLWGLVFTIGLILTVMSVGRVVIDYRKYEACQKSFSRNLLVEF